jgi:menaquinone-dependent protoporphyrinogen oxidase
MRKVLVAYASKHHSTAEIADVIGAMLELDSTLDVDVRPVETVKNVTRYDAVVLGSAVYAGQWQTSAAEFLNRHVNELAQRPVWLFSSGPTGEGDPKTLMKGWAFPVGLKSLAEFIKPRDVAFFHGKIDLNNVSLTERNAIKMAHAPIGDFRNWDMIRNWATKISEALNVEARQS